MSTVLLVYQSEYSMPAGSPPHSGPGHLLEDPTVAGGLDITPQHGFYHLDTHGRHTGQDYSMVLVVEPDSWEIPLRTDLNLSGLF